MTKGPPIRLSEKAFTIVPAAVPGSFVFASPHSGDLYPDDMRPAADVTQASIRSAEDARVDRLIHPATDLGAVLVLGRIGRAYVDLNRDPADLDPALIEDVAAGEGGARAAAGYGVIPRLTGDGRPLYARRLSRAEAAGRIETFHAPYHAALANCMHEARARHERAVLVDWHSMPSRAVGGAKGVDVVLGDRFGTACDPRLTRRLRIAFEALGWRVALNQPYAGGWTTQVWGRPDEGFHAVQIELSRALYLDENTGEPGPGWSRCEKGVARVIRSLLTEG
jgi:N-formylglutamate amidohydrolase